MSRFNHKKVNTVINYAGGKAYKQTDKLELVSILLTSFLKDQFYRSADETVEKLRELSYGLNDKLFLAKAAIFARNEYGMRSVSHLVAGEIIKQVKGQQWVKYFIRDVVRRPDDMTEILSYYKAMYNDPIPCSFDKGIALALDKFDEYSLAKYKGEGNDISLVDLINLCHPKPTEKNSEALRKLMKGELKSFDTWENELSEAGKIANGDEIEKAKLKKQAWHKLIKEKKIGYFSLLRNLRNIIEQAPDIIDEVVALLTDRKLIKKSLVLPFRYMAAIKVLEEIDSTKEARKAIAAVYEAMEISLDNMPEFSGNTLVVLDTSGSMEGKPQEIGSLFSAVMIKKNNADFMSFSDNAKYHNYNPNSKLFDIMRGFRFISGGTNFHSIFKTADKPYDRIIILSDMQGWIGDDTPTKPYNDYKNRYNCNPFIYSFDLAGYGTLQFPQNNVFCLAGFSEKTLDLLKILEEDKNVLIKKIENTKIENY